MDVAEVLDEEVEEADKVRDPTRLDGVIWRCIEEKFEEVGDLNIRE